MSDESIKRERFGRYLILDHLVDGGMAKISRARFLGEQADKVVAIKMVQPQYSKDEAFKTMFMDEIKVTFGLSHPNVIQTYDYGIHAGQLFVAMEYCDGRNLKEYIEKLKDRKFVFPVEISIYIISQACQGLYYAHTFRDKLTGVASCIIHRDISPHNIMMSYDGAVKIIDFGIAKSTTNSEATQAGTIKGKLSYLAPEYLDGLELDPRYDQFALGITLWEMLCNRKLFKEKNDLAILKKIQECKIPVPSSINPNVPKELDEIVMKALSKNRDKRYDNLDLMNRALMKILYAKYPDFNATDLSFFSQELFREEIKKDREKLFEFGRINIKPFIEDLKQELEGGTKSADAKAKSSSSLPKIQDKKTFEFDMEHVDSIPVKGISKKTITKKLKLGDASLTRPAELSVKDKTIIATSAPVVAKTNPDATTIYTAPERSQKTSSKIDKTSLTSLNQLPDEESLVVQPIQKNKKQLVMVAAAAALLIIGGLYFSKDSTRKNSNVETVAVKKVPNNEKMKGHSPASVVNEENITEGTITLTHFDSLKMQVFIDGKKEEPDTMSSLKVPLQNEFTLRVQIDGKKHFIKQLRVENSAVLEVEIPEMPSAAYGYMNTSTACTDGEITYEVFGEKRHSPIPLKQTFGVALPLNIDSKGQAAPQTFTIFFTKQGELQEKKIEITVKREDQAIDLCEFL
jgi:serine/threonine-protein kinase